jgi:hypothetical protein
LGERQRGKRGQVADVCRLGEPLRGVTVVGARLAQTAGVLEAPLDVSISGGSVVVGVGHFRVHSWGFRDPLPASSLKIDACCHRNKTS